MSSFNLFGAGTFRPVWVLFAAMCLFLQACQVQPLYSSNTQTAANLQSIAIKPVNDRVAQQLRNRLIFLYSGGKGEPASPEYTLMLNFSGSASALLRSQLSSGISAQRYTATAKYILTDRRTATVIGEGRRKVVTFYDQTTQEFASRRARRDAENRAAEQLAEIIRADTASLLSR